jgi:hypothetical protein
VRSISGSATAGAIQVATVATARKLTVMCRHLMIRAEDYAFTMPSLVAHTQRKLQLRAGCRLHGDARAARLLTR